MTLEPAFLRPKVVFSIPPEFQEYRQNIKQAITNLYAIQLF